MNIRTRLTLQFSVIVTTILLIFSILLYVSFANYRQDNFYKRLLEKGHSTAQMLINLNQIDGKLLQKINRNTINVPYTVDIFDENEKQIYSSAEKSYEDKFVVPNPGVLIQIIKKENEFRSNIEDFELAGQIHYFKGKPYYVITYAYDVYGWDKLSFLRLIIFSGFLVSIFVSILAAWIYSGQSLNPIAKVVEQVDKIDVTNLNSRVIESNSNDEVALLEKTFNKMLTGFETSFNIQKRFVADSSNALQAPLVSMMEHIKEILKKDRSAEEYEHTLREIMTDVKYLSRLSNGLLDFATANFDYSATKKSELSIDDVLWLARYDEISDYPEHSIDIEFGEISEDNNTLTIQGNEQLLKTAFVNIIDNACKYSHDKHVDVLISSTLQMITVSFKDNGMGIEPDELKKVFYPFYRSENAKHIRGHGLGLSIARRIVNIHNGNLKLVSEKNKGTLVILEFLKTAPNKS